MRLDFHTHIGPYPTDKHAEELIDMLDENLIDRSVSFPSRGLHASPTMSARANDYVAEAVSRYPNRITGFCSMNPWHRDEALAEFERGIRKLSLKGLKLHPPTQGFDVYDRVLMDPVMQLARELDVPVVIHGGLREHDNPLRFALLAQAHPQARLVMLHSNFGGADRVATQWAAENTKNLFFETSATNQPSFVKLLNQWSGGGRIFYGSDWPWLPPRLEMAMIECSGLPEPEIAAILGNSAAQFLGL